MDCPNCDLSKSGEHHPRCPLKLENLPTKIDFTVDQPQEYNHQTGLGGHGRRVVRYDGKCASCDVRCYSHDDGDDDPRGILGDHALGETIVRGEKRVILCYNCADDDKKRQRVYKDLGRFKRYGVK